MKQLFAPSQAAGSLRTSARGRTRNGRVVASPFSLGICAFLVFLLGSALGAKAQSGGSFFQEDATARQAATQAKAAQNLLPGRSRSLTLNVAGMRAALATAPLESRRGAAPLELVLPLPDGTSQRFRIVEASIMAPELAAKFPELKTYTGVGVDDPTATVRLDMTPQGFHAQVLTNSGGKTFYVEPVSRTDAQHYLIFFRKDVPVKRQVCGVAPSTAKHPIANRTPAPQSSGTQLRTYRLAVAANGEYTAKFGGTKASGMAAVVTVVNAIVGEYERELAVRFVLVANNDLLIYTDAATDPYDNSSVGNELAQNQANLDAVIGTANYDIGHVFGVEGGGGVAQAGVCDPTYKARGATGIYADEAPTSTVFIFDFVAHEMGHQFGANHSFNSEVCASNRNASTAYEPGSGTTTMFYAGVCYTDDVQPHNDFDFHVVSYEEIQDYIASSATCAALTATGNTPPVVTLPAGGLVLPISTPFKLTASATDANNDPLTYSWQEYDLGPAEPRRFTQVAGETPPLFRSFSPTASPTRYFPQLDSLVANISPINEPLPSVSRALNFRMTVRDMHNGAAGNVGGQTSSPVLALSVTSAAGPFLVTAPNTAISWAGNSTQTVTWAVAGTTANGVNCSTVNIRLSTDGGLTYPVLLLAGTANDGTQAVVIPNTATTTARVMVEAVGNYFFDISNSNFTITPAPACAAPTALAVSSITATSASVAFTASSTAASYTVTTTPATTTKTVTTSPVALTGLTPGTAYTVSFVSNCTGAATPTSPAATVSFTTKQAAPTITSLTPNSGPVGANVTVAGTGFTGATSLTFNGTAATFTVVSATSITTSVPAGATTGNVVVTTPGGTASSAFTVSTVAPTTVAISSSAGTSGSTTGTSPIPFAVTFSKAVTGFAANKVTVGNGTLSGFAGSGTSYTFTVTPTTPGTATTVSVAANQAQDANGNGNTASSTYALTYIQPVTAAPVVTTPANGSLLTTTTPTYVGTAVTGSTVTVFVDGTAIGTTTATAGSFSLVQPTALAQGSHTVRATAQASGQAASANSNTNTFTVDTVAPTVAISSSAGTSGSTTSTSPIPFSVTFSEAVTGFTATKVTVSNGTLSGFAGSGTSYTFTVTPTTAGTATTVAIAANAAQDAAGNGNVASSTYAITYTQPVTTTPAVTVLYENGDGNPTNSTVDPFLQLVNTSSAAIPYQELTLRYYLTVENFSPIQATIGYAQLGTSGVQARYVALPQPAQGALGYIEYSFTSTKSLAAGANSGVILSHINKQSYSAFDETDDYSYGTNTTSYLATNRITVYRNGTLIGGTEPGPIMASVQLTAQSGNLDTNASTNSLSIVEQVRNLNNAPIAYQDIALRYWFTPDGTSPLQSSVGYAQLGSSNMSLTIGQAGTQTYAELHFAASLGNLGPFSNSGQIILHVNKQNYTNFIQTNDYSFRTDNMLVDNPHVTVYWKGQLVYGQEPAGATGTAAHPSTDGSSAAQLNLTPVFEAFPNPFVAQTELHFRAATSGPARLVLYNALGQVVQTFFDGPVEAGHDYRFSVQGTTLAAGIYLGSLQLDGRVQTVRLLLTR